MEAYNELEHLLLTKAYTDLTTSEKQFVATQLTPEEYIAQREMLLLSRQLLSQPPTVPASLSMPNLALPSRPTPGAIFIRIAAGLLLLGMAFYGGYYMNTPRVAEVEVAPVPQIEYVHDTIFITQTGPVQFVERLVRDTIYITKPSEEKSLAPTSDSIDLPVASQSYKSLYLDKGLEMSVEVY